MGIRNIALFRKTKGFIKACLELLGEIVAEEGLPQRSRMKYVFEQDTQVTESTEEHEDDFSSLVMVHSDKLSSLVEFKDSAKYILRNPTTRKASRLKDETGKLPRHLPLELRYFRILCILLLEYLRETSSFVFEEEVFRKIYLRLEKFIYGTHTTFKVIAPLQGLTGNLKGVPFSKNLQIHRLSELEKTSLLQITEFPYLPGSLDYFDFWRTQFILSAEGAHKKNEPQDTSEIGKNFEDILTTLRLFKAGQIYFPVAITRPTTWTHLGGTTVSPTHTRLSGPMGSYEMQEYEKTEMLRLWRKFKNFKRNIATSTHACVYNAEHIKVNFDRADRLHVTVKD